MATVKLSTLVSDVRNRLGNVVFSKWKDTNYVREYTSYSRGSSDRQVEVRSAFALLVSVWKTMGLAMHNSWNTYAYGMNMTGFNAFIKVNSKLVLEGNALELFKSTGEDASAAVSAVLNPSSGEIICQFSFSTVAPERHVIFFTQKIEDGKGTGTISMHEAGINPVSPFTISSLEPGVEYFVYAVVMDSDYATAENVSSSVSMRTTAGA
jgi:hypothetical protein